MVSTLIDQERRTCRNEVIDENFYGFEAEVIKKIPLSHTAQEDTLIWPFNPTEEYTVKSRYTLLQQEFQNSQSRQSDSENLKPLWKAIWGLKVPSKVKNFVWRATKNSLPTKTNLLRQQIISEDVCEQCNSHKEDVAHALYHCPKLQELWQKVESWNQESLQQAGNFIDLIGFVFAGNRDPALFAMVIWSLWTRRNNLRLSKPVVTLPQLLFQARERLRNFSGQHSLAEAPAGRPLTRWRAPDQNSFKVNFDGALFTAENRAELGVIICNDRGEVMVSLSQQAILPFTAIEVEAMAARRALELALETGFDRIILEGDSQILISALTQNSHCLAHFGHLLDDIRYLASCFSKIQYSHVHRHCNTVAYSLARLAISFPQMQVWMEDVPPELYHVLLADSNGLLNEN